MKKTAFLFVSAAFLLAVASPAFAQTTVTITGCADSPENPTVVLALVGSAGAFLAAARTRLSARRNSGK